jgi:hypothetical protein
MGGYSRPGADQQRFAGVMPRCWGSPNFRTDLVNVIHNCTMYDLIDGTVDPGTFSSSDDVWALMASPNPARFTTLTSAAGSTLRSQRRPEITADVLKLVVNKMPMRSICEVLDINPAPLYGKLGCLAAWWKHPASTKRCRSVAFSRSRFDDWPCPGRT